MASAKDRLALARTAIETGHPEGAVSAAYYAMLYAARAALSEDDRYAKTHSGTWMLFRERFVAGGRFDAALEKAASSTQRQREAADYDAVLISSESAEEIVGLAGRFVSAVEAMLVD
jgi:uncharacterized protein (UPF0332 family)